MPKVDTKPKSPTPSSQKPEEEDRSFDEVTMTEKVIYVISKIGIFAFFPQYQAKIDRWNPQWIQLQNKKELQYTQKWGISALTAIRVGLFVAMAGVIVGAVFASPILGFGILTLIGIGLNTLLLTALLYNLILLMKTPTDHTSVNEKEIERIVKACIDEFGECRTTLDVDRLAQQNAYEEQQARRKEAKENGEEEIEMGEMNVPHSTPDPAMITAQDPTEGYNPPYPQANGPEIEMGPMDAPQNHVSQDAGISVPDATPSF